MGSSDRLTARPSPQQARGGGHRVSIHPGPAFVPFADEDVERTLTARFGKQVRRHASRVALRTDGAEWTYDRLNRAANRVAHAILSARGARAEAAGILLGHDPPAVVANLAVMKAGKICVALDSSYPRERLGFMLADSGAGMILTDARNARLARDLAGPETWVLNVDEVDPGLPEENPDTGIRADAIANIVYTSGSTGRPKGVVFTHRFRCHALRNLTNAFLLSPDDRFVLLHALSFSASGTEMFGALANGGSLSVLDLGREGMDGLARLISRHRITVLNWMPTGLRHFCSAMTREEDLSSLRLLLMGSEPLTAGDVALYKKHFPRGCTLVNRLGATEVSNFRHYFVDHDTEIEGATVPAGFAVPDKEVLLLDEAGNRVPDGHVGRIAVRSRYTASGYWGKPALTRAAFLPDPDDGEARLVLTGDRGFLRPDGCLISVGRADGMVKVRGYRIEIAEVEAALLDVDGLAEGAVVTGEGPTGDQCLVAYLVAARSPAPAIGEVRRALSRRLPQYMIPSRFIWLDSLPRLPNGKLNRLALPAPDECPHVAGRDWVPPRTPLEETLAAIWAEALGLYRVGVHDHFLEIGGNSLLATRVVARVRETLGTDVPLRILFEASTVGEMAGRIIERLLEGLDQDEVGLLLADLEQGRDNHE